jgi:hypothetical protein
MMKETREGRSSTWLRSALAFGLLIGVHAPFAADAGEADDLQARIDSARQGTQDLERLDEHGAVREDVTLLRTWLDEAWRFRSEQEFEKVRDVLKRCDFQTEMIRQRITASKLVAQAAEKEAAVKKVRASIEKTKQAIQDAMLQKAALEAKTK